MENTKSVRLEQLDLPFESRDIEPMTQAESVEINVAAPKSANGASSARRGAVSLLPPHAVLGPHATMRDLLDLVLADTELSKAKRGNVACSNRKFVEYMGLDLNMRADFLTYREPVRRFTPASARISKRRWSNIMSDVSFALKRYGGLFR